MDMCAGYDADVVRTTGAKMLEGKREDGRPLESEGPHGAKIVRDAIEEESGRPKTCLL